MGFRLNSALNELSKGDTLNYQGGRREIHLLTRGENNDTLFE